MRSLALWRRSLWWQQLSCLFSVKEISMILLIQILLFHSFYLPEIFFVIRNHFVHVFRWKLSCTCHLNSLRSLDFLTLSLVWLNWSLQVFFWVFVPIKSRLPCLQRWLCMSLNWCLLVLAWALVYSWRFLCLLIGLIPRRFPLLKRNRSLRLSSRCPPHTIFRAQLLKNRI